jgi:hypothetical protein
MKKLQYIHELEGRRGRASAALKEQQAALAARQQQHDELAVALNGQQAEVSE